MSKISVIVPVYKVENYLARCVDSILAQTFKDYELILVDDGSPDNCPKICDEYAAKYDFIKVIHKENGGLSDARNFGIDYVMTTESEWITFIDSDDWVHPQYLEILYNACIKNGVDISSCGFTRVKEFSKNAALTKINDVKTDVGSAEILANNNYNFDDFNISVAWARLYRKTLLKELRFPIGNLYEDEYIIYKIIFSCKKQVVVNANLYYYFNNTNGISKSKSTPAKLDYRLTALKEQIEFFLAEKHFNALVQRFECYVSLIKEGKSYCRTSNEYKNVVNRHEEYIKSNYKNYKKFAPMLMQKYGYKKYINGEIGRLEDFKHDYNTIKSEKGLLFAYLWKIKQKLFDFLRKQ